MYTNINTRKQNNWHHQHDTNTNISTPPPTNTTTNITNSNRNHYNLKLKQSGYEVKFRCWFPEPMLLPLPFVKVIAPLFS